MVSITFGFIYFINSDLIMTFPISVYVCENISDFKNSLLQRKLNKSKIKK